MSAENQVLRYGDMCWFQIRGDRKLHTYLFIMHIHAFIYSYLFHYRERERERSKGGGAGGVLSLYSHWDTLLTISDILFISIPISSAFFPYICVSVYIYTHLHVYPKYGIFCKLKCSINVCSSIENFDF